MLEKYALSGPNMDTPSIGLNMSALEAQRDNEWMKMAMLTMLQADRLAKSQRCCRENQSTDGPQLHSILIGMLP